MEEVKFIKTGEEFSKIATKLKRECVKYLTQVTKENGLIDFDLEQADEYVCVSYDGGSHPEYGGNLYSTVYSVSFNKDKNRLSIETEDDNDYTVDRLSADELYTLALVVYNKLKD
jgi:hypothetical protein